MQRWNPYETVLGVGNVGGLRLKWKNPSTTNGTAGTLLARSGKWGGLRRPRHYSVYALNASTGAKLWSYTTGVSDFLARRGERGGLYRRPSQQRVLR